VALFGQGAVDAQGFGPTTVQDLAAPPAAPQFVPGEVIVKLKPKEGTALRGLAPKDLAPLGFQSSPRQTSGGELIYEFSQATLFSLSSAREAQERVLAIAQELNTRPDVEYAQPNWILQPMDTTPNDPGYPLQWHYRNNGSGSGESPGGINLPRAWDNSTGSASVAVAVIDTGILPNHPDITGSPNLAPGYDMISDTFVANDGDGRDGDPTDPGDATAADECFPGSQPSNDSWHGTHVAGTVGVGNSNNSAGVAGSNWQVTVVPVRVLGKCGGTIADINDAIRWAAGLPVPGVPANPDPARVINMSLGGGGACSASPSTQNAINDAVAAGATVVVAAGNSAADAADFMPASCDNVITVAASDYRGQLVTRYSNFGATVDIMAPGGDVQRDDDGDGNPDGVLSMVNGGYAFYNGTSMAAPHVSGVAALFLAADPSLTPAQVLATIQDNALPRSAVECPEPCGKGLLNAYIPQPVKARFEYAAKLVCGVQKDPTSMRLARGFYATTINVHNPAERAVAFTKKLALTVPPGKQRPGKVLPTLKDKLGPDEALAVDCDDLARRYFDGQLPEPYIEGFVVIRSPQSLDVTGIYSTAALTHGDTAGDHSSVHVEPIRERVLEQEPAQEPDLVVSDIGRPSVSCPGGGGTCVTTVEVTVANVGAADAGAFNTRVTLDPGQTVMVDQALPGLTAGASQSFTIMTPPGGNCFDPDCSICATADDKAQVDESDETNNQLCETTPG
jgi:serine protease